MNTEAIKSVLSSQGWIEIEAIFREEFLSEKRIKTEGKSNEQIVSEVKAKEYMIKATERFLKRLSRIANPVIKEKQSFR